MIIHPNIILKEKTITKNCESYLIEALRNEVVFSTVPVSSRVTELTLMMRMSTSLSHKKSEKQLTLRPSIKLPAIKIHRMKFKKIIDFSSEKLKKIIRSQYFPAQLKRIFDKIQDTRH